MSQTNWEADKMLDVYIYDYLMKRKLHASAKAFQDEGKVSTDPVAIDAPGGFLFEWWSVFWDIFIARTNEKHSEAAASFIETQLIKAREQQQQQQQQQQQKPQQPQQMSQNQQMQMQQLLLQRQAQQQHPHQQQRRDGGQLVSGPANALVGNDMLMRQNPPAANALAAKMYEERLKLPQQKDAFDDAAMRQRLGDNVGQILDPNQVALLKAAGLGGQPSGQMLHATHGCISGNIQQGQNRSLQIPSVPVSAQDIKGEMNSKSAGPEGSLIHGPNQGSNNLTLKGWPLPALDRFRPGLLQQANPLIQSSQPLNQLQQQLLLQAQQNLASPSANDLESRRLRMLLTNRNMSFGKDGQLNSVGDVSNVGSPVQVGSPLIPRSDPDMLLKLQQQQLQNNNQQRQQYSSQQLPLSSQTPQSSGHQVRQQDKVVGTGSVTADGSMSSSFQGNDQASKSQTGRKRKQPVSSSGPANSSGTANTTGPSPSSPSSPSTHTPGDAMSMPNLPHNGGSSKPLLMFGQDGMGPLTTAANQLGDIDRFVDDGSLEDNVESFLSDDAEFRDRVSRCADVSKGFSFKEARIIPASSSKLECCHFSPDGKLLATGGHDRKAILWCTENFTMKSALEEHSQWITDVRFSPSVSRLATSSADKTVRVWDVDNPAFSIRTFTGHSTTVMSLDFHPKKDDLLCSCDNNSEIRYWDVKNGSCAGVCKGGATQLRFQPCLGRFLAAAADNFVSLFDVETQVCRLKLQGHKTLVHSVCWDSSGEYLASVSDDLIRVWRVGSSGKGEYVHELDCTGNKFHTCIFHPTFPILVIGCYETLEIWNMAENKTMTVRAHDKLVSSLAVSKVSGLVASASHDKYVKLWQ